MHIPERFRSDRTEFMLHMPEQPLVREQRRGVGLVGLLDQAPSVDSRRSADIRRFRHAESAEPEEPTALRSDEGAEDYRSGGRLDTLRDPILS